MRMSLRTKLILSHTLPVLILVPCFGFYLLSSVRAFYFDRLSDDLAREGIFLADTLSEPDIAKDSNKIHQLLTRLSDQTTARIQVIGRDGVILASTDIEDVGRIGTVSAEPAVRAALGGTVSEETNLGDVATVAVPVPPGGRIVVVRLSLQLVDVEQTFNRLNWISAAVVLILTLLSLGISYTLGTRLSLPLQQLARESRSVAQGDAARHVQVASQDELADLAQSFNSMVDQLAEQRAARERLLEDVAHELRRPISALQSAAEVLRDGTPPDQGQRKLLEGLFGEMGRLGRLTQRLTLAAQDGKGAQLTRHDSVDIGAVVASVVTLFAPEAQRLGIQLICEPNPNLPRISADEDALVEVFTNLLDNALRFTPAGGSAHVSMGFTGNSVWVDVADTGMGLTLDEQAQLFKRFYRGDQTRARPRGIGLGLAIAYELVQAQNGAIRVSSRPEQGAVFRVELPC
jgi:two-component system sensor histidine kinase BaeS